MFYNNQNEKLRNLYIESLCVIGSLSNLFSSSKTPYLYYRMGEKVFCDIFEANNLSRGDIALDASKDDIGIGLKTFLKSNGNSIQKVAEFNKDRNLYESLTDEKKIRTIAKLRNDRIKFAENISSVDSSVYHCIVRSDEKFQIYEEEMDYINVEQISSITKRKNSIWFNDNKHEYNFNLSKSTLYKRFNTSSILEEFKVKIFENPLEQIKKCFHNQNILTNPKTLIIDTVYLPLYGRNKVVSPKSGLNQWNAGGRQRDANEIYIPIPAKIHKYKQSFFPQRDVSFSLHLPNNKIISTKVCQDNSKALMSNPNKVLGEWLLRDVLELHEGEILTYDKLQVIGVDCVKIDKIDEKNYKMSFASLGSYEEFIEHYTNEF